jgi:hypothetical protein
VHPPFSIDIASSDFSLWVTKSESASRPVAQIDEFFQAVEAIQDILIIETIAKIFSNWIERLQ